jgi:S1-C subfamily serine protease
VPRRSRLSGTLRWPAVALAAVVIGVAASSGHGAQRTVVDRVADGGGGGPRLDAPAVYARANPGVVDISADTTTTSADVFGAPETTQGTDTGTGMVLDTSGDILTAYHVVAGGHHITVKFADGTSRRATVLGRDVAIDTAVLRVKPSGLKLHPLELGTLHGAQIGDPVAVIGDPFDVQRSLSTGVISGLNRTISAPNGGRITGALQTDAAINPGNSGGPLLDAGGRVIGIANQIATGDSPVDSSTGVGFAVPIDTIKRKLAKLEAGRQPSRPRHAAKRPRTRPPAVT